MAQQKTDAEDLCVTLVRPDRKDGKPRFGKLGIRQWIESVFGTHRLLNKRDQLRNVASGASRSHSFPPGAQSLGLSSWLLAPGFTTGAQRLGDEKINDVAELPLSWSESIKGSKSRMDSATTRKM